jgi:DNA-directed RNA polymerase subunit RPC12/RpoP
MEIFALIGANPIPAIIIGILICLFVAMFKRNNTKHYFCTDCGRVVNVQFCLNDNLYQTARPCPKCGNNVASPYNTGQGRTHRRGGRNY